MFVQLQMLLEMGKIMALARGVARMYCYYQCIRVKHIVKEIRAFKETKYHFIRMEILT